MPRPDGTLYNWEKEKIKKEAEAGKPKPKLGRPPKPEPELKVIEGQKQESLGQGNHNRSMRALLDKLPKPDLRKPLTGEALEAVLADLRIGLTIESALVRAGIGRDNMDKWRKRNPALELEFAKAEADFEAEIVRNINAAARSDHRAGQWLLERRRSASWAPVTKQELTGRNGGPIQEITLAKQLLGTVPTATEADRVARAKAVVEATVKAG